MAKRTQALVAVIVGLFGIVALGLVSIYSGSTGPAIQQTQASTPPTPIDDLDYSIVEDGSLTVTDVDGMTTATDSSDDGLLANDSDPDSLITDIYIDTGGLPSNGSVELDTSKNGLFTYTPSADYCGVDSFVYTIEDTSSNTYTATAEVDVTCVNDEPVAVDDQDVTLVVELGSQLDTDLLGSTPFSVISNDTDPEGDDLEVYQPASITTSGFVVNVDGTFEYDADPATNTALSSSDCNNSGPEASFIYQVIESSTTPQLVSSNTATVDIQITCPTSNTATANNDNYTVNYANQPAKFDAHQSVLGNDDIPTSVTDYDIELVSNVDPAKGQLNLDPADGSFEYNYIVATCPVGGDTDQFEYRINNNDPNAPYSSNTATVDIDIDCIAGSNVAPNSFQDSVITINEGDSLILDNYFADWLSNDTDFDNDPFGVDFSSADSSGNLREVFRTGSNSSVAFDTNNQEYIYTPNQDFCTDFNNSTDTISYNLIDSFETQSVDIDQEISIECEDDLPVITSQISKVTNEDSLLTIGFGDIVNAAILEDPDVNFGGQIYDTSNYEIEIDSSNSLSFGVAAIANDGIEYTPTINEHGTDTIRYIVRDLLIDTSAGASNVSNVGEIEIDLVSVNDEPIAVQDAPYSANEDATLSSNISVLDNDTDVDNTILGQAANTGLTAEIVTAPNNAVSFGWPRDGSFVYTPTPDFCGADSFKYKADDGQASSNIVQVDINVICANDAPVMDQQSYLFGAFSEGSNPGSVGSVNATDADSGDTLSYSIVSGGDSGSFSINSSTGQVSFVPSANLDYEIKPSYSFSVQVSDGSTFDVSTVQVTVADVNESPVVGDNTVTIAENSSSGTPVANVSVTDPEGDSLSYGILAGNNNNAFGINTSTGQIFVSNNIDYESQSQYVLNVFAQDADFSDTGNVIINISDIVENLSPVFSSSSYSFSVSEGAENQEVLGKIEASDIDSTNLTYSIVGGNINGVFEIDFNGNLKVRNNSTLDFETRQNYNLTVQVDDGDGAIKSVNTLVTVSDADENTGSSSTSSTSTASSSSSTTSTVPIANAGSSDNEPPVAQFSVGPAESGTTNTVFKFSGAFSTDPDGDELTYNWQFADGASGSGEVVEHKFTEPGNYEVELTVTDTAGFSDTEIFTVGVIDPNACANLDDARCDRDNDGLTNAEEDLNGNGEVDEGETNPQKADTDQDGINDGLEVKGEDGQSGNEDDSDPLDSCSPSLQASNCDEDGDGVKYKIDPNNSNPCLPKTDNDRCSNSEQDTDQDGILDRDEDADSDGDLTNDDSDNDGILDYLDDTNEGEGEEEGIDSNKGLLSITDTEGNINASFIVLMIIIALALTALAIRLWLRHKNDRLEY